MLDNNLPPHPGEILTEEFLGPLGLTQTYLAEKLGVPIQRINEIARGKRGAILDESSDELRPRHISPQEACEERSSG